MHVNQVTIVHLCVVLLSVYCTNVRFLCQYTFTVLLVFGSHSHTHFSACWLQSVGMSRLQGLKKRTRGVRCKEQVCWLEVLGVSRSTLELHTVIGVAGGFMEEMKAATCELEVVFPLSFLCAQGVGASWLQLRSTNWPMSAASRLQSLSQALPKAPRVKFLK